MESPGRLSKVVIVIPCPLCHAEVEDPQEKMLCPECGKVRFEPVGDTPGHGPTVISSVLVPPYDISTHFLSDDPGGDQAPEAEGSTGDGHTRYCLDMAMDSLIRSRENLEEAIHQMDGYDRIITRVLQAHLQVVEERLDEIRSG